MIAILSVRIQASTGAKVVVEVDWEVVVLLDVVVLLVEVLFEVLVELEVVVLLVEVLLVVLVDDDVVVDEVL